MIEFNNSYTKQKWVLEKRYSEFDELHKAINKLYPKFPSLPGKSLLGLSLSLEDTNKRKKGLEQFLRDCINRKDIFHNDQFRKFIEIDKNSPEMGFYKPSKVCEYTELPLGIRDFIYLRCDKICFVACSDMNIASRVDAIFTNMNFPWEKKTDSHITVGAVFAFRVKEDSVTGVLVFEKLWAKSYPTQTGVISWDPDSNTLAVGLDDGKIYFYKTSPDSGYMHYEEICCLSPHKDRVMGIAVEAKSGHIYSVSTDKKFVVSEANYQESITGKFLKKTIITFNFFTFFILFGIFYKFLIKNT
jgi:hypothetical protein